VLELEDSLQKPVFTVKGITYMWTRKNNLYGKCFFSFQVMAVAKGNPNVTLILHFLHRLIKVFEDYFKVLEDESLRDNFVISYELLDEMMDNGYPQITETSVLKEYIKTNAHKMKKEAITDIVVPTAASNVVSWRPEGIKYKKNEIFLDVIEQLNMIVNPSGSVLSSEIIGTVKGKSMLTGMPELKLGLNDKV
jgi:AP-1 complex subunit mu